MATLQSLGLHEPSALHYLIAEGILSEGATSSSYRWSENLITGPDNEIITEEVLSTSQCAVWSHNGIIKRVFNLDIEGESIQHAFSTSFASDPEGASSVSEHRSGSTPATKSSEAALVVVLKTQAHIFLFSGDTHVVPLSFDVDGAFPCARGFVLQRTTSDSVFSSTQNALASYSSVSERPNDIFSPVRQDDHPQNKAQEARNTPRTFCYTGLLSEMGIVVAGSARRHERLDDCVALPQAERLLYISKDDEVDQGFTASTHNPVYVAVTINGVKSELSIWHVVFQADENEWFEEVESFGKASQQFRRQSSNVHERQHAASAVLNRVPKTFQESFSGLETPFFDRESHRTDTGSLKMESLAQQLGQEFEQSRVQTRSARRVSSMLARTDLGGANERSAFNESILGPATRKSLSRNMRREGSVGSFSDRQSFGVRRRSSFHVATSTLSNGNSSYLGVPGSITLGEFPPEVPAGDLVDESTSPLPRDIGFMKLKSFPCDEQSNGTDSDDFQILTLLSPELPTTEDKPSRLLSVSILERTGQKLTTVNIALKSPAQTKRPGALKKPSFELKAVEVQSGTSIADACVIADHTIQRLLVHSRTSQGQSVFHLEAPWSPSFRIDFPERYLVHHPYKYFVPSDRGRKRETGIRRIITGVEVQLSRFMTCTNSNTFVFADKKGRCHKLKISLAPASRLIQRVFDVCHFILPGKQRDSLLVAFWEVKRWLEVQDSMDNLEWTAITITMFLMAVPFIGALQDKAAVTPRRKKGGLLRSSSGTTVDLSGWEQMRDFATLEGSNSWMADPCWRWSEVDGIREAGIKSSTKHSRNLSTEIHEQAKKNLFLIRCTNLARDFLQSPAGENMIGPEGYLPTAINKERDVRRTSVASILVGLHLLREELKLESFTPELSPECGQYLAVCIAQLGAWLRWHSWKLSPTTYYGIEVFNSDQWLTESSHIDGLETPNEPFPPPSILQMVETGIKSQPTPFPTLLDLVHRPKNHSSEQQLRIEAARLTPRTFALISFLGQFVKKDNTNSMLDFISKTNLDARILSTLPEGILAVVERAQANVRAHMIDEQQMQDRTKHLQCQQSSVCGPHDSVRDHRTIGTLVLESETLSRWDMSSEMDRQTITRLIFSQDRRFQEASKLVNQTRPPEVEYIPDPGFNEANLLEAQKQLAQHVTRRTLAVATGRGIMHFNARTPLLTERVPIPAFSLQCVMKPSSGTEGSQAMTFSADKALFTEEKVCWAFFHNGASAGLMISKDAKWIDTSWILYNKPAELTNRHAGFLLALGLNGHLKSLARWVAFKYLTPKHTMTSVGLLLGLAASYLGTADTLITRLISVHVTCLLPPGAAELNLSPLTQATGIMGIGLLYYGSQHRRMSEVMLSEIESRDSEEQSGDEPILRDEGYRLTAGLALGLINLGQGLRLHAFQDVHVVERLLSIAVGTKNVNLVHVLDRATAGAVIGIAFIFMKTNDAAIARKIDIPDTSYQFDYVRPDIFLLRTLARHLIMWDNISPDLSFVQMSLPSDLQHRVDLKTTKRLSTNDLPFFNVLAGICFAMALRFAGSQRSDVRDLLISYLDQFLRLSRLPALNYDSRVTLNSVRNCLDILALSAATVVAGSGDLVVLRRLRSLHGRTDGETPFGSHLAAHMAIGTLFLSGGTATFGTSNLAVASLVIAFYPLFPNDVLDNRGHLQALRHLWVLAVEQRCLVARDAETRQVIGGITATVHHVNSTKTQVRSPGLLPDLDLIKSLEIGAEGYEGVKVDLDKQDENSNTTLRDMYKKSGQGMNVVLRRCSVYNKPNADVFSAELQALDEARGVPSVDANAAVNEKWRQGHGTNSLDDTQKADPFEWIFDLDAFKDLDYAERALVQANHSAATAMNKGVDMLNGTVIDSRLEFELGILGVPFRDENIAESRGLVVGRDLQRNKLWQLRLLLAWADYWEQEEEDEKTSTGEGPVQSGGAWLRQEVIDKIRWRLWKMSSGGTESDEL